MGLIIKNAIIQGNFIGSFDGFSRIPGMWLDLDPEIAIVNGSDQLTSILDKGPAKIRFAPPSLALAPLVKIDRGFKCVETNASGMIVNAVNQPLARAVLKFLSNGSPFSVYFVQYVATTNATAGA